MLCLHFLAGTGVGYHALTIGMYMDQLVRHVDPKRRGLPQFFQEEIAEPFGNFFPLKHFIGMYK